MIFFVLNTWLALATAQAAPVPAISYKATYTASTDPLTTEKVWILDPGEFNPHRQRWVLNRSVELVDFVAVERADAKPELKYGVRLGGLRATTTAYYRPAGPWYRGLEEFPCAEKDHISWFGTLEGAQLASHVAAKAWESGLEAERAALALELSKIRGASSGVALIRARELYDQWLKDVEAAWRVKGRIAALKAEWALYRETVRERGLCKSTPTAARSEYADEYSAPAGRMPVPWELMMEPPGVGVTGRAGIAGDELKLLARAPAKLWDGLFSVRLNLSVSGRKLNGTFLIDSGSGTSVVSPEFLAQQGLLPAWVQVSGAVRRVPWGGTGSAGGLAPVVAMDLVELGNTPVRIKEFALFDSEFFSTPENPVSCCDGVLGTDFLRHYVVELQPGPPAEVKLWPAENFHISAEGALTLDGSPKPGMPSQWIEAALTPDGHTISACMARPQSGGRTRLVGVRWDTGRENALDVHVPWQKQAQAASRDGLWELRCGPASSERVALAIPASYPKPDGTPETSAIQMVAPAASVGMELLGRGRVFLDYPHGRIWFPEQTSSEPIRRDHSGLGVRFEFIKGHKAEKRGLYVRSIAAKGPVQDLVKRGLRTGMIITQIDKQDADELDAREVSKRFAGVYSEQVYVQWKSPQGLRLGVMKVR